MGGSSFGMALGHSRPVPREALGTPLLGKVPATGTHNLANIVIADPKPYFELTPLASSAGQQWRVADPVLGTKILFDGTVDLFGITAATQ
jgi:hypothetical protein